MPRIATNCFSDEVAADKVHPSHRAAGARIHHHRRHLMHLPPTALPRRSVLKLATGAMLAANTGWSWAQQGALPAQARIFVGFPPGGAPDIVARRLAQDLTGRLAQAVIVENRPGAGSRIALDAARQAPPDGLTLLLSPAGIVATNPHTYKRLNYKPFEDLTPITLTNTLTFGFAVGPAVPPQVRDVRSFAAWARSQPGTVAFASPAAGAPPHFVGDHLSRTLDLGLTHVPYRGSAPAFNDLFGAAIAAISITVGDLIVHHQAGKLRILGVSGMQRSPFAPAVPTFAEQGIKGLERDDWFGLYIAGKAAPEVVQRLSAITRAVQTGPDYQKALRERNLEPAWSTPEELDKRGREDLVHWGPIIKATGFEADS
jgi:tripartite-type tricarboxylate transporter receptor subunit TctC